MNNNYKVVYSGSLKGGTDVEQFIQNFMQLSKTSEEQARRLVSVGRTVTLKKNLDQVTAEKYRQTLDRLGMLVHVESVAVAAPDNLTFAGETPHEQAAPQADSANSAARCPKCGSDRVKDDDCQACGIIISRFRERQARIATETIPTIDNPYAAPQSDVTVRNEDPSVMNGPHSVPAGNGWHWIAGGWGHFSRNPFAWIGAIVVWVILLIVCSLIPFLGSLALYLLMPVFAAGFVLGADEQRKGGNFEVGHLFAGFSNNTGGLVVVGLLYMLGVIAILFISMMIFGGALFASKESLQSAAANPLAMVATFGIPLMVMLALYMLLAMAYWFAPALVALEGVTPFTAMKMSFTASLKNVLPFLVYGLCALVLLIVAIIPVGLGLFIMVPVMTAALYVSYRDIFYAA
jgi:uncharacterized membrane protein